MDGCHVADIQPVFYAFVDQIVLALIHNLLYFRDVILLNCLEEFRMSEFFFFDLFD